WRTAVWGRAHRGPDVVFRGSREGTGHRRIRGRPSADRATPPLSVFAAPPDPFDVVPPALLPPVPRTLFMPAPVLASALVGEPSVPGVEVPAAVLSEPAVAPPPPGVVDPPVPGVSPPALVGSAVPLPEQARSANDPQNTEAARAMRVVMVAST